MKSRGAGYGALPEVYDRWQKTYGKDFSALIFPRLLGTLRTYGVPVSSMVDLCCGTGSLALSMARQGWEVEGLDASPGMLRAARKKVMGSGLPVRFRRADMRSFTVRRGVGLITCMFDAVNHVTSMAGLHSVCRRSYRALRPGGYFIFDVNNELAYRTAWRQNEIIHHRDFTILFQNTYSVETALGQSRITVFVRQGGRYRRMSEVVRERCFTVPQIAGALERAGFRVLQHRDFNFTSNPLVGEIKTWWVARRPVPGEPEAPPRPG